MTLAMGCQDTLSLFGNMSVDAESMPVEILTSCNNCSTLLYHILFLWGKQKSGTFVMSMQVMTNK